MSEATVPPLNQQEVTLEYTNTKRKKIVEKLLTKLDSPTEAIEAKDLSIALQALDGMDRQALTLTRIKSDEGVNNSAVTAAEALIRMYMTPGMRRPTRELVEGEVRVIPQLPDDEEFGDIVVKAGEFDSAVKAEGYDEFMRRTKGVDAKAA